MRETDHGIEYIAQVVESRPLTPTCHGIKVTRHEAFDYEPVQYTFLSLKTSQSEGWEDYRPMSLASSPTRPHLAYGVRLSPSPWKQAFQALEPGDEVMVEGPAGHFILQEDRPSVLVAGGIGITPLKGMTEYHADKHLDPPMTLVYSSRTPEEIVYRRELEALADQSPGFQLLHTITRPEGTGWQGRTGRIDGAMLQAAAEGMDAPVYYLCGLPQMVSDLVALLEGQGVPSQDIHYEEFWGY